MPYATNAQLPPTVRDRFSDRCQDVFRRVFNETTGDEGTKFAIATTAANTCKAAGKEAPVDMAVKFAEGSDSIIEGYGIPFGGPAYLGGKDFHGESFSPDTDLALDWFPHEGRPFLFHHGLDAELKTAVVGRQIEREVRDAGHWVRVQLDKRSQYMDRIKELVDAGALSFSSGSLLHLVKTNGDGSIKVWPWVELSGTPTPANPDAAAYAVKAEDAIEHLTAVKAADALKSILDSEHGSESEPFAVHAERVTASVDEFADRVASRDDARIKSGRSLSAANRAEVSEVIASIDRLRGLRDSLADLIARSDPATAEAAKAAEAEYVTFLREEARQLGVPV